MSRPRDYARAAEAKRQVPPDDDDSEQPIEAACTRCHGDGMDPWNDYLLPCPECQGEQQ